VGVDLLVETGQHLFERPRLVDAADGEGGHAAQGHRADHAQCAQPDPRCKQIVALPHVHDLAGRRDHPHADHLRRDVPKAPAGPVGGCRDRPRDRLPVHVALVLERQAVMSQDRRQRANRDAALHGHEVALDAQHAVEAREVDHHPVGASDVAERVTRAGCLYLPRTGHGPRELGLTRGPLDALG
jgi:hypothetical protein